MADELNTPTHRWQQRRNNIALAKTDFSKKTIFASGIAKIDAWINSQPWGNPLLGLYAAGEPGFTFEPWDITTLYQDRAGTTPVTDAGQSVGLRLDKSGRGNHQVAVSDAKRGIYGWMPKTGKRNLLMYTEDFSNAAWAKLNQGTGVAPVLTPGFADPDGSNTAWRLQLNAGSNGASDYSLIRWSSGAWPASGTRSIWLRSNTGSNQTVTLVATFSASRVTVTPTWQRFSQTLGAGSLQLDVSVGGSGATGATADILICQPQVEGGSTATAYQRVVSQYDITEAGVPTCYYVQADGVDDAYVTPTITPNTDKAQVFAGVQKLSDAASAAVIELSASTGTNAGSFVLYAPLTAAANFATSSRGDSVGASSAISAASFAAPISNVITGLGDISGDTATLRVNGVQVAQSTADQGTGNYLAYPAYLYARGGTTLPFNGLDFGHAVRFGPNLDAATIARVESLIARNTPEVTL